MAAELRVIGTRELVDPHGHAIETVLAQPKRFALLTYLVLDGPFGTHSRDALLAMFWPEHPSDSARNSLTQALSFLRRALGQHAIVNIGRDAVKVDRSAVRCDAADVLAALERGDGAGVDATRGPMLPGFFISGCPSFERWLEGERAALHAAAIKCARRLLLDEQHLENVAGALHWAEAAMRLEPCAEQSARACMELCMLSGDRIGALRAFDTHAAALRAELDASPSRGLVALRHSIQRTETIADSAVGAMEPAAQPAAAERAISPVTSVDISASTATTGWVKIATGGLAAIAAVIAATLLARTPDVRSNAEPRAQLSLVLDDSVRLRTDVAGSVLSIDPTGTSIAYVGGESPQRIYVRTLDDPTPRAVPGSENARMPQFSADGRSIAFRAGGKVLLSALGGGTTRTLVESANRFSLRSNGGVVYESPYGVAEGGLHLAMPSGKTQRLTRPDSMRGEGGHNFPHVLPDGSAVLFQIYYPKVDSTELAMVRIGVGVVTRFGISGVSPRFVRPGFLVFGRRDGQVMGVRFDPVGGRVIGHPVPLLSNVRVFQSGDLQLALADNGTLVYLPSDRARQLTLLDPAGKTSQALAGPAEFSSPRVSPDGRQIAVTIGDRKAQDVWILDVVTRAITRFTADSVSSAAQWAPDGRSLLWTRDLDAGPEIWSQPVHRREPARRLIAGAWTAHLTPSSRQLVTVHNGQGIRNRRVGDHVRILQRDDATGWRTRTMLRGAKPAVSSNGRLLAYQAEGIFVRELDSPFRTRRVSETGGADPVWVGARDLMYRENGRVVMATIDWSERRAAVATRGVAADRSWGRLFGSPHFDVMPDGARMVVVEPAGTSNQPTVVLHWTDGLRERMERLERVAQR